VEERIMKIWVDDLRTPPDETWTWCKKSFDAIMLLANAMIDNQTVDKMSLDHDLGGDDTTRKIVLWCAYNNWWPVEVTVHSANPVGVEYLEGVINRYKPTEKD